MDNWFQWRIWGLAFFFFFFFFFFFGGGPTTGITYVDCKCNDHFSFYFFAAGGGGGGGGGAPTPSIIYANVCFFQEHHLGKNWNNQ